MRPRPRCALAILSVILLLPCAADAQAAGSAVLDAPAFVDRLRQLAAPLGTLEARDAAAMAASIPDVQRVRVRDAVYDVSLREIRQTLLTASRRRDWPVARRALAETLAVMQREVEASLTPASQDRQTSRRALDDVLARPEFARGRGQMWRAELRRRLQRWLADLFGRTIGRSRGLRAIGVVLAWTAPALALIVLVIWLTRIGLRIRREPAIGIGALAPPRAAANELADGAVALAAQGRFRDAARAAYRAAVRRLEEEGTWRTDDARTPREYLRLLPAAHRRRATLARLTADFERVWYGSPQATADDWRRFLSALEDLGCLPARRAT
ncbi:MAG: hypothetical protein DMF86_17215 [Acidobacteria bacterium]|nr:MAG: hypothetical protein DMF86_17215 [Acidobacteriota bacterium]